MISVFISHTWSKSEIYIEFVSFLNSIIGSENWENCSIPVDMAIDLLEYEKRLSANEIEGLEAEYYRLKASLMDPKLPKVSSRKVIREGKLIEVETEGTIINKIKNINERLLDHRAKQHVQFVNSERASVDKGLSLSINKFPTLSHAIEKNLKAADFVFVLLVTDVYLRDWMNFEMGLARSYSKPTYGVIIPPYAKNGIHDFLCDGLIKFNKDEVKKSLAKFNYLNYR